MKNIYDIRYEKRLYYILSKENIEKENEEIDLKKVAIFVNLYYEEYLGFHLDYLKRINNKINIYIISSNINIIRQVDEFESNDNTNFHVIKKENRGRDISALLIAAKEVMESYEYICFLHDKKSKAEYSKSDICLWINNLWENMIASDAYVKNILNVFQKNKRIGLLVPPEPIGDYFGIGDGITWYENFENTLLLKQKLSLECSICLDKSPITLGSVFWCKKAALKKLFEYNWRYTDFQEEPLPADGTLSHAIERIFGYVAQDAGYDTGTVMTSEYASLEIAYLYKGLEKAFSMLRETTGIKNLKELYERENKRKQIDDFFNRFKIVYLYGAGKRGIDCLKVLMSCGYMPEGFVVTSKGDVDTIEGLDVIEFNELEKNDSTGIIITAAYGAQREIIDMLNNKRFNNYITFLDY